MTPEVGGSTPPSRSMENSKLFIITRADLPPGAIAAQSVHAALAFAHDYEDEYRAWYKGSNNIVLLSVPDEAALIALAKRALDAGVSYAVFREPDFGDTVTGVALGSAGARLVSSLPLALRPLRERVSVQPLVVE